jgi:hypothetical protein
MLEIICVFDLPFPFVIFEHCICYFPSPTIEDLLPKLATASSGYTGSEGLSLAFRFHSLLPFFPVNKFPTALNGIS